MLSPRPPRLVNIDDLSPDEQPDRLEEIWERLCKHAASVL
jgi:hypothetical protein